MPGETENKTVDYGALLADLEAKRTALDTAITSLKAAIVAGALGSGEGMSFVKLAATVVNPSVQNGEVPAGAFLGKSIPEAARLYLSMVKKKQTTKEIADALREGGIETNSKNFEITVGTGLHRVSRNSGEIIKLKGAWGLAEWYPSGMRGLQGKTEKRKTRKAKRMQHQAQESNAVAPASKREASASGNGHHPGKLRERAVAFINEHPSDEFSAKQLSEKFGIHSKVISMTLAKPVKVGLIKLSAPGVYRAVGK